MSALASLLFQHPRSKVEQTPNPNWSGVVDSHLSCVISVCLLILERTQSRRTDPLLQSPAIAEDCYILAVFYLFSHHRYFDAPGPMFAKLCHTTRFVLQYFISYTGVHMCPLKI